MFHASHLYFLAPAYLIPELPSRAPPLVSHILFLSSRQPLSLFYAQVEPYLRWAADLLAGRHGREHAPRATNTPAFQFSRSGLTLLSDVGWSYK